MHLPLKRLRSISQVLAQFLRIFSATPLRHVEVRMGAGRAQCSQEKPRGLWRGTKRSGQRGRGLHATVLLPVPLGAVEVGAHAGVGGAAGGHELLHRGAGAKGPEHGAHKTGVRQRAQRRLVVRDEVQEHHGQ